VELIRACLGRDIDLARFAAKLGGIDSALHLELLQRVDGRQNDVRVEIDIRVLHAIEREVIVHAALSGQRDVLPGSGSTLAGVGLSRIGETKN